MKYLEIVTVAGIKIMKLADIIRACKRTTEVLEGGETEREQEASEAKSIVAVEATEWWERR